MNIFQAKKYCILIEDKYQNKSSLSPLGKAFEKQTKTIKDQGEKQTKTIEEQGKETS